MKKILLFILLAVCGMTTLQAQDIDFIRVNCTVKLKHHGFRGQLINLANQLVQASQQDEGMKEYDLLMSIDDEDTFMIYETWASQSSLDKHQKSAHFTSLIPQIQKIADLQIEQFDQPKGATDLGHGWRLNLPFEKSLANIEIMKPHACTLIEQSHTETECRGYDIFLSLTKAGHCLLVEDWPSQAALDNHLATNHYKDNIGYVLGKDVTNRKVERFFYNK